MKASDKDDPLRIGTIWALNLDEPTPAITPGVAVTFSRAGPESALALGTALAGDHTIEVRQRFETGRRCYTAWVKGKLAAYGWISFDEEFVGELGLRLRLLPGEAYIWDCATVPAFRRHHLYSALLIHMVGALRAEKMCRVWIGADIDNVVSQRGIERAGFRRVADLMTGRKLPLRQLWVEGRPGMPERLVTEACRVFLSDRNKVWLEATQSTISQPCL